MILLWTQRNVGVGMHIQNSTLLYHKLYSIWIKKKKKISTYVDQHWRIPHVQCSKTLSKFWKHNFLVPISHLPELNTTVWLNQTKSTTYPNLSQGKHLMRKSTTIANKLKTNTNKTSSQSLTFAKTKGVPQGSMLGPFFQMTQSPRIQKTTAPIILSWRNSKPILDSNPALSASRNQGLQLKSKSALVLLVIYLEFYLRDTCWNWR